MMQNQNTYVAIMAGGIGSRFWPASRDGRPKQFLDILGVGKSLIRLTYERFLKLCPPENILIVTNKKYKQLVMEHLPELGESQILCEPSMNNTAPCIAYTGLRLRAMNPEASFVVAPSDHVILKEDVFISKLHTALEFTASNPAIATLGIQPTRPDTGYGYINYGEEVDRDIHAVKRFTEKPDLKTAKGFLESGDYLWNGGIFIWKVDTLLAAFRRNAPGILDILEKGNEYYNTDKEQAFIDEAYPTTPKISVDYAIMEKADNIHTIPADIGWSDLGTWNSLYVYREKDERGNVVSGHVIMEETEDCIIHSSEDKLTVVKGLKDYILVDEGDVLLVYPKQSEQEVKGLVGQYKKDLPKYF